MTGPFSIRVPYSVVGFGAIDRIDLILKRTAANRALVISDQGLVRAGIVQAVTSRLRSSGYTFDVFDRCHEEPSVALVHELRDLVAANAYDLLIGVGGGSVMDATKVTSILAGHGLTVDDLIAAMAQPERAPTKTGTLAKVLIPTTAGTGSEWSLYAVLYDERVGRQERVLFFEANLADAVIIDPELTLSLPPRITADTGMDALTHAIEAYTCAIANVFSDTLAASAIEMIAANLRLAYAKGSNREARLKLAMAASLAMNAASCSGVGIVHFMNEPLAVKAHIAHGKAVALLLPHVMAFNLLANPAKFAKVAELMGERTVGLSVYEAAQKSVDAVTKLRKDLGMPERMRDVGVTEADIDGFVNEVLETKGSLITLMNPRDASRNDLIQIYRAAL